MAKADSHGRAESPGRQRDPLARAIQLLTLMVDEGEVSYGVRQLGTMLGVTPSTAHRLLTDLEKIGMVRRTDTGAYILGLEFHRLAWASVARFPLRVAAEPVLHGLRERTGESAFLGVYSEQRHEMTFASRVESAHPLRYVMELNTWVPLYAGASGLAILAHLSDATVKEVLNGSLRRITEATVTQKTELNGRLAQIRDDGYALSHGERIVGAVGIAAPVFGAPDRVVGDVGITLPETRFDAASADALAAAVKESAAELTEAIGGRAPAEAPPPSQS